MKKLALTSLLAVFAVSGAHAANVINNNPLYRPQAGQFYSVTALSSHSEATEAWALGEEFGYGITNKLSATVKTAAYESDEFDVMGWDNFGFGLNYRAIDMGAWKADVFGEYGVGSFLGMGGVWPYGGSFLDKDNTFYKWTVGVRGGYVTSMWTVAGHVAFDYGNSESFNWNDDGVHMLRAGLNGQYLIDSQWNLTAGVEYTGITDDWAEDAGKWTGEFGVNYNFDANKFLGAYVSTEMSHETGDWEFQDGFGFGVKFGAQF